jgi:hypothetical protein
MQWGALRECDAEPRSCVIRKSPAEYVFVTRHGRTHEEDPAQARQILARTFQLSQCRRLHMLVVSCRRSSAQVSGGTASR